jgi:hypothetical protein
MIIPIPSIYSTGYCASVIVRKISKSKFTRFEYFGIFVQSVQTFERLESDLHMYLGDRSSYF